MRSPPKTIVVLMRENYGSTVYYPVCDAAHTFARIAGTKTLTADALTSAQRLGFTIQVTHRDNPHVLLHAYPYTSIYKSNDTLTPTTKELL